MYKPLLAPVPDEPGNFRLSFDNSSMEDFITCSRKAQYHSVFRRKPDGAEAALFYGGVAHEALEIRKQAMLVPNAAWQEQQVRLVIERFNAFPLPVDEWRTPDNLVELLKKYNDTYPIELEPYKIVPGTIELPFSVPIGTVDLDKELELRPGEKVFVKKIYVHWTGRIDAIVELDGSHLVQDHKTASVMGPSFFDDFDLSAQMHGYTWAARQLGYPVAGLYLDVLGNRKPTKTGKPHELLRQRFFYNDEHVEEWKQDTFTSLTDFMEHLIRGYFPKGQKWCHGRFGTCPYWDVCKLVPSQRNNAIFGSAFVDDDWSPLADRNQVVA